MGLGLGHRRRARSLALLENSSQQSGFSSAHVSIFILAPFLHPTAREE
jgi:hypothetical protein